MPTYEPNPVHLREAIDSVLAQSAQDWDLLIHDDASVSDVRAIVEPYLTDSRITFVRSDKRLGIGGNWNACLRSVTVPVFQFLFQDDAWKPEYLASGHRALEENPSAGMISVGYHYQIEGDLSVQQAYDAVVSAKAPFLQPGITVGRVFLGNWLQRGLHPCIPGEPSFVMLRTSVVQKAGLFLEDMPQLLDCEYWARMLLHADWCTVPGDYGFFRVHGDSASARNQREGVGLYDRLRCLERLRPLLPSDLRRNLDSGLTDSLAGMIRKFFHRTKEGKNVSAQGGSSVIRFAFRHPFLLFRAGMRALTLA